MRPIFAAILLASTLTPLMGQTAALPAGDPAYIMVLRPGSGPEPDIEKLGGKKLSTWATREVVQLPDAAAAELRKDPRVKYLQRIAPPTGATEPSASSAPQLATSSTSSASHSILRIAPNAASTWSTGDYSYDGSGNVVSIGPGADGRTSRYTYDALSRVKTVSVDRNGVAEDAESYVYDSFGNRTSKTVNGLTQSLTVDPLTNQITDVAGYDAVGNVTLLNGAMFAYDPFSLVKEMSGNGYSQLEPIYTADDQRIGLCSYGSSGPCTWTLRGLNGQVLRQYESTPVGNSNRPFYWLWQEDWVYRDGQPLGAQRESSEGGRLTFHADHLGSTRLITNEFGQQVTAHDYEAYGPERTSILQESSLGYERPEVIRFTGQQRDFLAGAAFSENRTYVDYMHARYYEPNIGRFLSVDPLKESARLETPQSWNRYSYAWNDPVLLTDPTGMTVYLHGKSQEEIDKELEAIRASLHDPYAAAMLHAVPAGNGQSKLVIFGNADDFAAGGAPSAIIGAAISQSASITFSFADSADVVKSGGGLTEQVEKTRNSTIRVNPAMFPYKLVPSFGNVIMTMDVAILHEFGHALGLAWGDQRGRQGQGWEEGGTNPEALALENRVRAWYRMKAEQRFGAGSLAAEVANKLYAARPCHNPCF